MKVRNVFSSIQSLPDQDRFKDVLEREERRQRKDQQEQNQNSDTIEVTEEKVAQAIEGFQSDAQAKNNGLSAQKEGSGPGLKIVLKDAKGNILRSLSGEEFLKLRESLSGDQVQPGKILDQKL